MVRAITLLLLLAPALQAQEATPKLQAAKKDFDFGEIRWGKTVEIDATIKNVGSAPLELLKVTPDCYCTVADAPKVLAPGATGTIKLVFDSSEQPLGVQNFKVVIYSNDSTQREMGVGGTVLSIRGKVTSLFRQTPLMGLSMGEVIQWAEPVERTVTVVGEGEAQDGFQATLESPLPPWLQVQVLPSSPKAPGIGVRIRARILPSVPLGSLTRKLIFRTNIPAQPTFMVHLAGYVVQRITCIPVINLQPVERSQGSTEMPILLQRRDKGSGIPVSRIEYDRRMFSVKLKDGNERQRRYLLRVIEGAPPGPFASQVHFLLDDPQQKILTLRVQGYVTPNVVVSPPMSLLPTAAKAGDLVAVFRVRLPQSAKLLKVGFRPQLPLDSSQSVESGTTRVEVRAREAIGEWPETVELVLHTSVTGEETVSIPMLRRAN